MAAPHQTRPLPMPEKAHLLIVEARFYDDLADALLEGARAALEAAGATCDVVTVPGALEVPAAISFALDAAEGDGTDYDGFVALGCVIRGETYHFEIVANESSRALMELSVEDRLRSATASSPSRTRRRPGRAPGARRATRAARPPARRWR